MKVLFLDIDGVLNNFKQRNFGEVFSKVCCAALNVIIQSTPDLKIVISSAWRMHGLTYMRNLLEKNGIERAQEIVIDCTGREDGIRGYQIQCWLNRNPGVTHMVILDDESDMGDLLNKLVKTNSFIGLTAKNASDAIETLNKPI